MTYIWPFEGKPICILREKHITLLIFPAKTHLWGHRVPITTIFTFSITFSFVFCFFFFTFVSFAPIFCDLLIRLDKTNRKSFFFFYFYPNILKNNHFLAKKEEEVTSMCISSAPYNK